MLLSRLSLSLRALHRRKAPPLSKPFVWSVLSSSTPTTPTTQSTCRTVWSTGAQPTVSPYGCLTPIEVETASSIVLDSYPPEEKDNLRFVAISRSEPDKNSKDASLLCADVLVLNSKTGLATELVVDLQSKTIPLSNPLPRGVQPLLTPEDCELAEQISKSSPEVQDALKERYNITDMTTVAADPWSVHLADDHDKALCEPDDMTLPPRRLVQTFLYHRQAGEKLQDNHYAHPIDILPIVDLNTQTVVRVDGLDRLPPPEIPTQHANYHRDLISTNSYLQTQWRRDTLKQLDITQPQGPSFTVSDNVVTWQNWSFSVGFNYREGLVLHNVTFDNRSVMKRASLVEMAVPYADPNPPYTRKCAFDVGDYGLGYCANSLELGCDCLGHIHYFDAVLNDSKGRATTIKKAVCMHEEDDGILWKHVEYRNGHNESRRARELVISSIATVVNYEYLFYWRFKLDGSIDFEIRLSGELSTNLPSANEDPESPDHGVLCAPGVNSQIHQHMFSARLDMAVDGTNNTVSEVDVVPNPNNHPNPHGNVFGARETVLRKEQDAVRLYDASKARVWKISNAEGKVNPITKKATAYKLVPFTRGAAMPPLLTHPESNVSKKGEFATSHLWVTKYDPKERFPAGEYTSQAKEADGLPKWIADNDSIEGQDVVVWHSFGVTHVPRPEDFPVMPCETTGFTLKPDGFSAGNPAIDLPPETNAASTLNESSSSCCETK